MTNMTAAARGFQIARVAAASGAIQAVNRTSSDWAGWMPFRTRELYTRQTHV
jgi:hypothetical protein